MTNLIGAWEPDELVLLEELTIVQEVQAVIHEVWMLAQVGQEVPLVV